MQSQIDEMRLQSIGALCDPTAAELVDRFFQRIAEVLPQLSNPQLHPRQRTLLALQLKGAAATCGFPRLSAICEDVAQAKPSATASLEKALDDARWLWSILR